MGILLTFMFLWNMLGALVLIPALSHFLLNPKINTSTQESEVDQSDVVEPLLPEHRPRKNSAAIIAH